MLFKKDNNREEKIRNKLLQTIIKSEGKCCSKMENVLFDQRTS